MLCQSSQSIIPATQFDDALGDQPSVISRTYSNESESQSPSPSSPVSPLRVRRTRTIPRDRETDTGMLNLAARLEYLASFDMNRSPGGEDTPSHYHLLIVRVLHITNPNTQRYLESWQYLHDWAKSWQAATVSAFERHLHSVIETNDFILEFNEENRVKRFAQWYTPEKLQELCCFATKYVDFKKSSCSPEDATNEEKVKTGLVDTYFRTLYTWILEGIYKWKYQNMPKEKLLRLIKDIPAETDFAAIDHASFVETPPQPTRTKARKRVKSQFARDTVPSFKVMRLADVQDVGIRAQQRMVN